MAGSTVEIGEADLSLIDALQARPRAAWSLIGRALDVSGSTAARRWVRLRGQGLAWLTGYATFGVTLVAYLEVDCEASRVPAAGRQLGELGWVLSVEYVSGSYDLFVTVSAIDLAAMSDAVTNVVGSIPGVRGVRVRLATRVYREGSAWKIGSLDRRQQDALRRAEAESDVATRPIDYGDIPLLKLLGENGRATFASLADRLAVPEHAVRRRLHHLVRSGQLLFRCDFAHQGVGWPISALYRVQVGAADVHAAGRAISTLPEVRLCAEVTGDANLLVAVWLHSLDSCHDVETRLEQASGSRRIVDRAISLKNPKRMGWLLDDDGRATGFIPLSAHWDAAANAGRR